jgi:hypothetical protein
LGLDTGSAYVINCELSANKDCGLIMSKVNVMLEESLFYSNIRYAIHLPNRDQRILLKAKYKDHKRLINGKIGGDWGTVSLLRPTGVGCCGLTDPERGPSESKSFKNREKQQQ